MAPLSCALSFLVVRKIGGQMLADSQWSFVQKLMAKLDEYPRAHRLNAAVVLFPGAGD